MVWVAVRNFMVLLPLAVIWNQLEVFSADWTPISKRQVNIWACIMQIFFKKKSWLVCLHGWVHLSHRQGSGERRFVSFSSSFPFLLPLIFLSLHSTAVFHIAVKMSVPVSEVNTFEWKRLLVFEVWTSAFPGEWQFAFCTSFSSAQGCALMVHSTLAGEVVASYLCGVGETGLSQRILFFFFKLLFSWQSIQTSRHWFGYWGTRPPQTIMKLLT